MELKLERAILKLEQHEGFKESTAEELKEQAWNIFDYWVEECLLDTMEATLKTTGRSKTNKRVVSL